MGRSRFDSSLPATPTAVKPEPRPPTLQLEALPPEITAHIIQFMPVRSLARLALINTRLARQTLPLFGQAETWASQSELVPLLSLLHASNGDVNLEPLRSALTKCKVAGTLSDALIESVGRMIDDNLGIDDDASLYIDGSLSPYGSALQLEVDVSLSLRKDAINWIRAVSRTLQPSEYVPLIVRAMTPHTTALWTHKPVFCAGGPNPSWFVTKQNADFTTEEWYPRYHEFNQTTDWRRWVVDAAHAIGNRCPTATWDALDFIALNHLNPNEAVIAQPPWGKVYDLAQLLEAFRSTRVEDEGNHNDSPFAFEMNTTMAALRAGGADVHSVLGFFHLWLWDDGDDDDGDRMFQLGQQANLSAPELTTLLHMIIDTSEDDEYEAVKVRAFLNRWSRHVGFPRTFDDISRAEVTEWLTPRWGTYTSIVGSWIRQLLTPAAEAITPRDKAFIITLVERFIIPVAPQIQHDQFLWP